MKMRSRRWGTRRCGYEPDSYTARHEDPSGAVSVCNTLTALRDAQGVTDARALVEHSNAQVHGPEYGSHTRLDSRPCRLPTGVQMANHLETTPEIGGAAIHNHLMHLSSLFCQQPPPALFLSSLVIFSPQPPTPTYPLLRIGVVWRDAAGKRWKEKKVWRGVRDYRPDPDYVWAHGVWPAGQAVSC